MSLSSLFKALGAPLANARWSWGAIRPSDGTVFLRVWQDEWKSVNGENYVRVLGDAGPAARSDNLGYLERRKHVDLISAGASSYMIMCRAEDPRASPRRVAGFDEEDIFGGGRIACFGGDKWLHVADRKRIADVSPR